MKFVSLLVLAAGLASANIVSDVRAAIARNNFAEASRLLDAYRSSAGVTPEWLEALSWMGRAELQLKNYDAAGKFAAETYQLSTAALRNRKLDDDSSLPIALGAAIEVEANILAARNQRSEAVAYLQDQLKTFYSTSIRARIQKNLNLLTMEGKPAPALQAVSLPKGKPVLIFFWAHWCMDCKAEAPVLARILQEFGPKGLTLVAPTQRYGYIGSGEDAPPDVELRYIEKIRQERYSAIITSPAPVNEENFRRYGASTTPTLVLVDRAGIVRMYHPGAMQYEELRAAVAKLFRSAS
ncbi:MAG TPA: TlpA disulfide reductase family protein [Bryobacteraceae bacterium]|nr:TlpA disulfide reductase family protein [Bryobacteraceae bacterium]